MNSSSVLGRALTCRVPACSGFLLLGLLATLGCESKLAEISGTVTYQGKALQSGTVTFIGSDGIGYVAQIDAAGRYSTKVAIGDAKVMVNSIDDSKMLAAVDAMGKDGRGGKGNGARSQNLPAEAKDFSLIPRKYGDQRTSQLTFKVNQGKSTFDIRLE